MSRRRSHNNRLATFSRAQLIRASGEIQLLGPYTAIDLNRTRQNGGVVGTARIEALAINRYLTTLDQIAFQAATVDNCIASRDRHTAGVDKAAAVNGHSSRVRDNHLSTLTTNLNIAAQLAGQ